MKKIKFEVLLKETITDYNELSLKLSKCNSAFAVQMLLERYPWASVSCDFGTWYFSNKSDIELPSLADIEKPYIELFKGFKQLETQFNTKLSKLEILKKKLPFIKIESNATIEIITEMYSNTLLVIACLKKIQSEYNELRLKTRLEQSARQTKSNKIQKVLEEKWSKLETIKEQVYTFDIKTQEVAAPLAVKPTMNKSSLQEKTSDFSNINALEKETNSLSKVETSIQNSNENTRLDHLLAKLPNGNEYQANNKEDKVSSEWNSILEMKKLMDSLDSK